MSVRRPYGRVAIAVATGLVVVGCADRRARGWEGAAADEGDVSVNVTSDHFNDVVVYAGRDGSWRRIGTVVGPRSATFDVPRGLSSMPGHFRLRVHAIGGADRTDYVTDVIRVDAGDVIELRVASRLRMSHWWIRGAA